MAVAAHRTDAGPASDHETDPEPPAAENKSSVELLDPLDPFDMASALAALKTPPMLKRMREPTSTPSVLTRGAKKARTTPIGGSVRPSPAISVRSTLSHMSALESLLSASSQLEHALADFGSSASPRSEARISPRPATSGSPVASASVSGKSLSDDGTGSRVNVDRTTPLETIYDMIQNPDKHGLSKDEVRHLRRVAKNRRSAKQFRERQRTHASSLESETNELRRRNVELRLAIQMAESASNTREERLMYDIQRIQMSIGSLRDELSRRAPAVAPRVAVPAGVPQQAW